MCYRKAVFSILMLGLLCGSSPAATPMNVWMTGPSGSIEGGSVKEGRQGSSDVFAYSHTLAAEPDSRTCVASAVRRHFPVAIVKEIDTASPQLHDAWRDTQPLQIIIRMYRIDPATHEEVEYYRVELEDAFIADIHREMPVTLLSENNVYRAPMERISFTYHRITETWLPDWISYGSIWQTSCDKNRPFYDYNFDGVVDFRDFEILANQWLNAEM